jgi:mannose-6-phosphate isomerase-like protein (cupin superfamily)
MAKSRLEKYIRREMKVTPDIQQRHLEVKSPVLGLKSDSDLGNKNFSLSWWPISEPFEMISETHAHDFDQFLIFVGGDMKNMTDLGGEVELTLGENENELEKFVFTTATVVYIPAGLLHCPLNFKKVNNPNKPILFHDFFFASEYMRKEK